MADGSIIIDTRIDQKGINKGVQNIGKSLTNILNIVKGIGKALVAAFVGGSIISMFRGIVQSFDIMASSVGEKFKPLVDAFETLKGTLVNLLVQALIPAIPYLVSFLQWLTDIANKVLQVVAALFGFKQTVGSIMTKAASDAKKAAKEARGALAAFDQINVLQKQNAPDAPTGPTATPAPFTISDEMQAVADDILKRFEDLKKILQALLSDPIGTLKAIWKTLVDWFKQNVIDPISEWWKGTWIGGIISGLWENFIVTWQKLIASALETFQTIKENILLFFKGITEFVVGVFTGDWALAWQGIKDIVTAVFGNLFAIIKGTLDTIMIFLAGWGKAIQIVFGPAIESLKSGFASALTTIKKGFENTFNGIQNFIKGVINNIIDFINRMIQGVVSGINTVINSANAVGTFIPGWNPLSNIDAPRIPKLATGAVIPPNSQFLAVLGDQHTGRNIEAPEGLIRQILREEMQAMGGDLTVTMPVYLDSEKIYQGVKKVETRRGKNLVSGVVK
jgi:phage-related protein